jgi:lipopolysaccharide transport system permease protein
LEAFTEFEARAAKTEDDGQPVRVVEPASGWRFPDLRELWERRDLFYLMVRRDVSVRYRQSAIGPLWALAQPLLFAVVFSVFFGHLAHVPSAPGIPFPILALSGMVMWLFITEAITIAANSTVSSSNLISRVYFPRIVIPLAAIVPPIIDFAIAFLVLIAAMVVYTTAPSPFIFLLPVVILLTLTVIVGAGLWLSALNVRYRDVQQVVQVSVLLGFFITPIIYPLTIIPAVAKPFYVLNPIVGLLEAYRWTLFSDYAFPGVLLLVPVIAGPLLVVTGLIYFERMETSFADEI